MGAVVAKGDAPQAKQILQLAGEKVFELGMVRARHDDEEQVVML